jgi:tRNA U34 2-thiouridine synthase MnmA/TrmU
MITPQDVIDQLRARVKVRQTSSEYRTDMDKEFDRGYIKGLTEAADMVGKIQAMTDTRL